MGQNFRATFVPGDRLPTPARHFLIFGKRHLCKNDVFTGSEILVLVQGPMLCSVKDSFVRMRVLASQKYSSDRES